MKDLLHALRASPATWAGAIALAALALSGNAVDELDARRDAAADLQDAIQQAQREDRAVRLAAAIEQTELEAAARCRQQSPGSALVWTTRGEAVCVPRP